MACWSSKEVSAWPAGRPSPACLNTRTFVLTSASNQSSIRKFNDVPQPMTDIIVARAFQLVVQSTNTPLQELQRWLRHPHTELTTTQTPAIHASHLDESAQPRQHPSVSHRAAHGTVSTSIAKEPPRLERRLARLATFCPGLKKRYEGLPQPHVSGIPVP